MEKLVSFGIRKHSFFFIILNLPLVGGLYGDYYIEFPHRGVTSGSFLLRGGGNPERGNKETHLISYTHTYIHTYIHTYTPHWGTSE